MPEWLWSILVGVVVVGLIAALRRTDLDRLNKLESWTKEKERFDYEFRHNEYSPAITRIHSDLLPLLKQVSGIDQRVAELKDWKHDIGEAYLPRAVDEHERRLNKLDAKVFNGHK